jgi:hypothetical protein
VANKTRKRNLEFQEFKKFKAETKRLRKMYGTLEELNRGVFETFTELVRTGQINTFGEMANFELQMRVGTLRMVLDELDQTLRLMFKIPPLHFKENWDVRVLPGFNGAFARFRVNDYISVYLDMFDRLGYEGKPYWELYDGTDTIRFKMEDTEELLNTIDRLVELRKLPADIQELMRKSEED